MTSNDIGLDEVNVKTLPQAREVFLNITSKILLVTIHINLREDIFTNGVSEIFQKKKLKFRTIGGPAAVVAGAGVATVGAVLIPFTLGASIGIMASGAAIGAIGAGVSIGVSVERIVQGSKIKKEPVANALRQLCNLERELAKLIVMVNITHGIITDQKVESSEDENVENDSASHIPDETAEKINAAFASLIQYMKLSHTYDSLPDACKDLADLTEKLKIVSQLILELYSEYVDAKAHYAVDKAYIHPWDYLFQIPESSFILDLIEKRKDEPQSVLAFWLNHLDVAMESSNETEDLKFPTNTFVNEHKVLETRTNKERLSIADVYPKEDSRHFGVKILMVAKGLSAAKHILQTSGDENDLEFLGKSYYDFLRKDGEEWLSAFATISDLMIAVNKSLIYAQQESVDVQQIT